MHLNQQVVDVVFVLQTKDIYIYIGRLRSTSLAFVPPMLLFAARDGDRETHRRRQARTATDCQTAKLPAATLPHCLPDQSQVMAWRRLCYPDLAPNPLSAPIKALDPLAPSAGCRPIEAASGLLACCIPAFSYTESQDAKTQRQARGPA